MIIQEKPMSTRQNRPHFFLFSSSKDIFVINLSELLLHISPQPRLAKKKYRLHSVLNMNAIFFTTDKRKTIVSSHTFCPVLHCSHLDSQPIRISFFMWLKCLRRGWKKNLYTCDTGTTPSSFTGSHPSPSASLTHADIKTENRQDDIMSMYTSSLLAASHGDSRLKAT